jgi:serine/threonine protein phosphatase PrpC
VNPDRSADGAGSQDETTGSGPMRFVAAQATDIGNVRETNEDSALVAAPVYMVADGMGGHNAGEVASAIAVEEFSRLEGRQVTFQDLEDRLGVAEERIVGLHGPDQEGAGTTVALVATTMVGGHDQWLVMNVGDSRVYRHSDDGLTQISVDHSVVQELVARGELTAAEALVHPYRNLITRAVGGGAYCEADHWTLPVAAGDRILVCSDGLTGEVGDEVLTRILSDAESPREACTRLVNRALVAGGHDNVTVVVVDALDGTSEHDPRP